MYKLHSLAIAILSVLPLIGCGQGVSGNGSYVTVSNVWSDADALPEATKHCAKWGKEPRLKYFDDNRFSAVFDCVKD
jgi:hypothetical protein